MISDLDPEQAASVLDPVLRDMAAIVTDHGGFVAGLRGDGIKAVFGIPLTLEDHAERACASALGLRAMARRGRLRMRVGVHSGEVLVRRLQSEVHEEYDAVGVVVHLAARLEQAARPGSIWISAATANLAGGHFNLRSVGRKSARGIRGEVEVFELLGETGRASRPARGREELGKFVNRSEELRRLVELIDHPEPVIGVSGDAGCGKSRLLRELLRRRELARWTVLKAEVEADDTHAGLRPFAHMLRRWLKTGRHHDPAQVRARLVEHVGASNPSAPVDMGALHRLLDVSEAGAGGIQKEHISRALTGLIAGYAESDPVVVVVEDVHWLSRDGLDLLRALSESAAAGRLAIIQTCRDSTELLPGVRHGIALKPLSVEDARSLLDARMGTAATLDGLKARIAERAGGVPLFIEELAKFSGGFAETDPAIPDSIHAVIGGRVDRLPKACRDALRTASVIGREMPLQVLCSVMKCSEAQLEAQLRILEREGFIRIVTDHAEFTAGVQTRPYPRGGSVGAFN